MPKQNKSTRPSTLRPYQEEAVAVAVSNAHPRSRHMLVLPPGAGKSRIIAEIVERLPHLQILVITPRLNLLTQLEEEFCEYGVLSSTRGNDLGDAHTLVIGTYQTVVHREIVAPDLIIIDENHVGDPDGQYGALINSHPEAAVIGLTATPYRRNKLISEGGIEWKEIFSVSISTLIAKRYLVPPRSMATSTADVDVFCATGSQTDSEITERIVPKLVEAVRKESRKKCLVFCVDIRHAEQTRDLLRSCGETCVDVVHSRQTRRVQDQKILKFKESSQCTWLVNVGLVSIGVDIPAIDCIAILRDVDSFALLVQMIGRGLRVLNGKLDCLVYDFGQGTRRYGFVDKPWLPKSKVGSGPPRLKCCPSCLQLNHPSAMVCPGCKHLFPRFTSLSEAATSRELLSSGLMAATYLGSQATQDERGVWQVVHQLGRGHEALWASTFSRSKPDMTVSPHKVGAHVVVKRIHGDLVNIIGP